MNVIQGLRSGAIYSIWLACDAWLLSSFQWYIGMVSSKIWTSPPETITKYAQSESDVERLVGVYVVHAWLHGGYCWPALRPGRSPYRVSDGLRAGMSAFTNVCMTKLWHQGSALVWGFGHLFMQDACSFVVGCGQEHKGHFGSVCILHLLKFRGVVRKQSVPAFNKKLKWPATQCWLARLNPGPIFAVCLKDNYVLMGLDQEGTF